MDRRTALKQLGGLGGVSLLAGCGSVDAFQSSGGLVIKHKGDTEPNKQRVISVTIGAYEPNVKLESGSAPPEWDSDVLFQALHRLAPGEQLKPDILIDKPGQYRFDVWVENRGTIGTEVEITEEGRLAEKHIIIISSDGMSHRRP